MDLTAILAAIPGSQDAVKYITAKVADFQRLPSRMDAVERQAIQMKALFDARNDYLRSARAAAVVGDISKLRADYNRSSAGVADVLDGVRNAGLLGGIDVNLLWTTVKTAGTMAGALTAFDGVAQAANQLQTELKPEEQKAMGKKSWSPWLWYALLGLGGCTAMARRRGRRSLW